eukprot:gene6992-4956_t
MATPTVINSAIMFAQQDFMTYHWAKMLFLQYILCIGSAVLWTWLGLWYCEGALPTKQWHLVEFSWLAVEEGLLNSFYCRLPSHVCSPSQLFTRVAPLPYMVAVVMKSNTPTPTPIEIEGDPVVLSQCGWGEAFTPTTTGNKNHPLLLAVRGTENNNNNNNNNKQQQHLTKNISGPPSSSSSP